MMCLIIFGRNPMKKLTMIKQNQTTFKQGCNMYLTDCKQRNLREGTINHYRQSYTQFYKYFNPDMPLSEITEKTYKDYVCYLRDTLDNDVSINSYLRDLITTFHFLMNEGLIKDFNMRSIKVDKAHVETYTEDELRLLLQKPDIKKCSFIEFQSWVMTNFLFSTGVRQRSLMNIKIKDLDFENDVVYVNVTKNRKPLIVPISKTMKRILKEFLNHRQHQSIDDFLFCNVYGKQLTKSTCYHQLYEYNKRRGVNTTGIHRYRHTFAKQWVLNGGNVITLQKLLGHSSLDITQNYINLLISDAAEEIEKINILDKFIDNNKRIKM